MHAVVLLAVELNDRLKRCCTVVRRIICRKGQVHILIHDDHVEVDLHESEPLTQVCVHDKTSRLEVAKGRIVNPLK